MTTRTRLAASGVMIAAAIVALALLATRHTSAAPNSVAPYPANFTISEVGIRLSSLASGDTAAVSQAKAVELALADAGPRADGSKPYSVQLTRLTDPNYGVDGEPPIINDRLVWLVRFTGTPQPVFGPAGREEGVISYELNVVVDATTGSVLESFSYR